MKRLIFFGTQDWAGQLLEHLIKDGSFEVALVVTQPDQEVGRKKILTSPPVKQVAIRHGLRVVQPKKLRDPLFMNQLKDLHADMALIIAYGRILPEELLSLYPLGTINVHPSLLPKWRGPSPVQAAIANGDTVSGVTIMKIDSQMDHGPIFAQKEIRITGTETFESFMKKVVETSESLLTSTLKEYVSGSLVPTEQNQTHATICKLLTREDGHLNWNQTASEIERMIRAYHPWPGTWSELIVREKPMRLKVLQVIVSDVVTDKSAGTLFQSENKLVVATGNGTLEIISLQLEGKEPMRAQAFLSGYAHVLGSALR